MATITSASLYKRISEFLFFLALVAVFLVVILGASNFKYLIFLLSALAITFSWKGLRSINFLDEFKKLSFLWLPWVICTCLLIFVHGTKNLTQYINAFLIISLLFTSLFLFQLNRNKVINLLSLGLILINSVILYNVFQTGLTGDILDTNKNRLIGVITFITVAVLSTVLVQKKNFSSKELFFAFVAICLSLVVTIATEVRHAILAYGACGVVLLIFGKKFRINSVYFFSIFLVLIALSFFSGRMQTGIEDLNEFQKGNANTSWGLRIEMWKMALRGFPKAPFFGWGDDAGNAMEAAGILFPIETWNIAHFHSDFFIALATGGLTMVLGWLTTVVSLIRNAIRDIPRLCLITSILATGLVEQDWFEQNILFPFIILWTLFYLTDPSRKEHSV